MEKQRKTEKRERDSGAWGETHSERRRSERGGSQWKDHEKNYKRQTPPPIMEKQRRFAEKARKGKKEKQHVRHLLYFWDMECKDSLPRQ